MTPPIESILKNSSKTDLLLETIVRKQSRAAQFPSLVKFPQVGLVDINPFLPLEQIVGADNREEIRLITNPQITDNTASVVAVFTADQLIPAGGQTYACRRRFQTVGIEGVTYPLCSTERFIDQPQGAISSGLLIREDLVVTTRHSVNVNRINEYLFIFGFTDTTPNIHVDNIYRGQAIFAIDEVADWVLIQLDRSAPVERVHWPNPPEILPDDRAVYIIGFPCGLPMKFGGSALVRNLPGNEGFIASFDAYKGNSGSPIFDIETHQLIGLVASDPVEDFVLSPTGTCCVSNKVPLEKWSGDKCVKATEFVRHLQP